MSGCDENTIHKHEEDGDPDIETSTKHVTAMAPVRTPGATLRTLLAHNFTTSTSPSSSTGISYPISPPPPHPLTRSSNQINQPVRTISEIIPRLFLSDIFTALNAATLHSFHITHIISVIEHAVAFPPLSQAHEDSELRSVAELGSRTHPTPEPIHLPLMTLHIPIVDLPAVDIFSYFSTTRDFIVTALKDENSHVLVHCYKGQSRSPTIVAAYLMSTLKISTSDALQMIQERRPMVLPNRGFLRQLEQWEGILKEEENMVCSDK